jgi:hypothetical protein
VRIGCRKTREAQVTRLWYALDSLSQERIWAQGAAVGMIVTVMDLIGHVETSRGHMELSLVKQYLRVAYFHDTGRHDVDLHGSSYGGMQLNEDGRN